MTSLLVLLEYMGPTFDQANQLKSTRRGGGLRSSSPFLVLLVLSTGLIDCISPCFANVIGDFRVDGTYSSDPADVLKVIQTPIGASLSSPSTRLSLSEDLRRISELGVYDPLDLRVETEGPETLKTVVFKVKEYPLVLDIRYIGDTEYKKKRLDTELGFEADQKIFFRPGLIDQFEDKLETFYNSKGFSNVFIEGREGENTDAGVILEFVIEAGNKLKLQEVGFEGNTAFTDKELRKVVKTKPKTLLLFRKKFDEDLFDQDMQRLRYYYQSHGFLEADVEKGSQTLVKNDKRLDVNFEVEEGPQYLMGDVYVEGASTFSRSELMAPLTIQPRDVLDRPKLIQDLQEVRSMYWNQGYVLAQIEPEIVPDPDSRLADLYLRITENPRLRLRNIRIQGVGEAADGSTFDVPLETKDYVIQREFTLEPGEVLDWSQVDETERKLINTQFFESQQAAFPPRLKHGFQLEPVLDTDEADLLLQLEETDTGFIQFGGGFSTDYGPSLNIEFKDRNAFGRAWQYSIGADIGKRRTSVDLSFYNPRVNNSLYSTRYSLFYRDVDRIGGRQFGEKRIGGSFALGRRLSDTTSISFGYGLERVEIQDIKDEFILREPDDINADIVDRLFTEDPNTTSSVNTRLTRDTRDYVLFPTKGAYDVLGVEVAGLGGDNNFTKFSGTFDRFFKLREKLVFAVRGHAAFANPFGDTEDIPLQERYFLGGANSIRGFRSSGVSPYRIVRSRVEDIDGTEIIEDDELLIGGEAEWFSNLELRYRFSDAVQSVVFFDSGSVYEEVGDFDFSDIRASVGTGLRLTLFGNALIRLDLGFPVAMETQDEKQSFQFNFGANF
ncbi:MAG: outer membrane protein assembly factor BamA [Candidatus Omnitrophica bacterium]|nr:outer membrane protein assembly factor BamA [Candidatus Omnitrophota bacterium]